MVSVDVHARVVLPGPGESTPTGKMTFMVKKKKLGTVALIGGQATLDLKSSSVMNKSITIVYSGDPDFPSTMATSFEVTRGSLASPTRPMLVFLR
jgi:Bacterial Ig-like domain (group 3)